MKNLNYLDPLSKQTLREGIKELRIAEGPENDAVETIAPELKEDIYMHDAIHVLFGCSTDLKGEILAHIWTLFGTSLKMQDLHRVIKHQDHRMVLSEIGHLHLLKTWLRNFPHIVSCLYRAMRMKPQWPAQAYAEYLDIPLYQLRADFRICLHPSSSKGAGGGAALRNINMRLSKHQNI